MTNDVQTLHQRADTLLAQGASTEAIDTLLDDLRCRIHADASSFDSLGPLFESLHKARKRVADGSLRWMPVEGGHLALGPRPKLRRVERLPHYGTTHVLTLLSERERAESIAEATRRAGMQWLWFPLRSGQPPEDRRASEVLFGTLRQALAQAARIYVHCAAGIHRTGMITYAFLRWSGQSSIEATAGLRELRTATASGVGRMRTQWGDGFGPRLTPTADRTAVLF